MNQREKLIWMLSLLMNPQNAFVPTTAADYLIEHGVVVLPCRCGDCEHWSQNTGHCWITQDVMLNTDFCSYAKRKGGLRIHGRCPMFCIFMLPQGAEVQRLQDCENGRDNE